MTQRRTRPAVALTSEAVAQGLIRIHLKIRHAGGDVVRQPMGECAFRCVGIVRRVSERLSCDSYRTIISRPNVEHSMRHCENLLKRWNLDATKSCSLLVPPCTP